MIRVALLTTDSREHFHHYDRPQPYFGSAPAALLEGFAALADLEVHVISCLQRRVPAPGKLAANIYFHALHVPKLGWMRTGYQGCVRAVRRRLRQIKPDIVHGQGTERDCGLAAVLSGHPNVVTIHGHMRRIAELVRARPFTFYWFMSRMESWVLRRAEGVICITTYTQRAVQNLARRTWLVPNAVGGQFFNPAIQSSRPVADRPLILCVGHISPWKNQNWLIQTLDPLARQRPVRLRFIGQLAPSDPYSQEFLSLIEHRPWCEHLGLSGQEVIRQHLAEASLLVLPSLEENCPMVVLEAMAAGVPVVAANVGGVGDLVQDGVTGRLVDSQNEAALCRAVSGILEDSALARRLQQKAAIEARQRFHPEVIARRHVEIYRTIVS